MNAVTIAESREFWDDLKDLASPCHGKKHVGNYVYADCPFHRQECIVGLDCWLCGKKMERYPVKHHG